MEDKNGQNISTSLENLVKEQSMQSLKIIEKKFIVIAKVKTRLCKLEKAFDEEKKQVDSVSGKSENTTM